MIISKSVIRLIVLFLIFVLSCGKKEQADTVLVRIEDKLITVDEFKKRAEFTIRPEIFADKAIVLNNLVAEKLLAIEAEKSAPLLQNEYLQNFVKGITEQAMREQLFYDEIYNNVTIESREIDDVYALANRTYELAFYAIGNKTVADSLTRLLEKQPADAPQIFDQIAAFDSVPKHALNWDDPDSYVIHDALFSTPLAENAVIGPMQLEDDSYLIVKIIGWKDQPVIGPEAVSRRRQEVQQKLKQKKAEKQWQAYMQTVMQGKSIEFDTDIFNKVAELSYSVYAQGALEDKLPIEVQSQQLEPAQLALSELMTDPSYTDLTFFTIDGQNWSVQRFKNEIACHPLVFRKSRIYTIQEFKKQYRAAVADLVRDRYLTQIAYTKNLEKAPVVVQTVSMWRDATLAQSQWNAYAKTLRNRPDFDPQNMKGINNYLGQYVDSLMSHYQDQITITYPQFQTIRLTKVPMYVYKPGMPYPAAVPVFPQLTLKKTVSY